MSIKLVQNHTVTCCYISVWILSSKYFLKHKSIPIISGCRAETFGWVKYVANLRPNGRNVVIQKGNNDFKSSRSQNIWPTKSLIIFGKELSGIHFLKCVKSDHWQQNRSLKIDHICDHIWIKKSVQIFEKCLVMIFENIWHHLLFNSMQRYENYN